MANLLGTYSFLDVLATITGPGGSFSLGSGAGDANEGITIEYNDDKDRMLVGADGSAMHSLIASKAGRCSIRILKTSPTNAKLSQLYTVQTQSSLNHGKNVILVSNQVTGDQYTLNGAAFAKFPRNDYATEAGMLEWLFNIAQIDEVLGAGVVSVL